MIDKLANFMSKFSIPFLVVILSLYITTVNGTVELILEAFGWHHGLASTIDEFAGFVAALFCLSMLAKAVKYHK